MTRIALFQSNTGIDPEANARALADAVAEAAAGGAEMLFTPEMSGMIDQDSARAAGKRRSEQEDPVLAAARDAAKRNQIWLDVGSIAILADGDGERALKGLTGVGSQGDRAGNTEHTLVAGTKLDRRG